VVPVRGSWILKLSGTGPVCGPSKKGNGTGTGPDFKALGIIHFKEEQTYSTVTITNLLSYIAMKLNVERESEGVNWSFFLDIWIGVNSIANRND
jgi:hypothetical protein